jgi:transcriptional regulator with XRE-family HTH domain
MAADRALTVLGRRVRALRREHGIGIVALATRVGSSKSVLSRLELGQRLPDPNVIVALDAELHADGELVSAARAIRGGSAVDGAPHRRWTHNYPSDYHGEIWIEIRAEAGNSEPRTSLELRWGAWVLRRAVVWPASGQVRLWHSKGDDGLSIPLIVTAGRPVHVAFHAGRAPKDAVDVNAGWVREEL